MADTGAPWNIPFAEPSDLVRDWPALSEDVADAVAAGLSAAGNAGIGSNVVQTVKTDTFTSTSTSFVAVTGLTAAITPSSDTAKVLVRAQVSFGLANQAGYGWWRITGGNAGVYIGDADGSRTRAVFGGQAGTNFARDLIVATLVYLDEPATTSQTTYGIEVAAQLGGSAGGAFVNRSQSDDNNAINARGASSITVIEVEA